MSTQVTQCPNCQTSFRVTQAQLDIANGKVRCGSCLHIFLASDHWSTPQQPVPPEPAQVDSSENLAVESTEPALQSNSDSTPTSFSNDKDITQSFTVDFDDAEILQGDFTIKDGFTIDTDTREMQAIDTQSLQAADDAAITHDPIESDALETIDTLESLKQDLDQNLEDLFSHDESTDNNEDDQIIDTSETDEFVFQDTAQQSIIENFDDEAASALLEVDDDGDFFIEEEDDPSLVLDEQTTEAVVTPGASDDSFDDLDDDELLFSDDQGIEDLDADLEDTLDTNKPLFEEGLSSSEDFEESKDDTDFSDNFLNLDALDEPANVFDDMDNEESEDTESWAQQLLEEDTEEVDSVAEPSSALDSRTTESHKEIDDLTAILNEPIGGEPNTDDFPDLLDDSTSKTEDIDPDLLNILGEPNPSAKSKPYQEDEFVLGEETMVAGERLTDNKDDLLAGIEPEPVMFNKAADKAGLAKKLYSLAMVASIALLGLQYVIANFDNLARDGRYRGFFATVCDIAPCTVPSRQDISSILSSNLIVRSHPSVGNALVVDTIITNRASFTQPYPSLELQFTNLDGEVVAQRRFKPTEYLSGELSGSNSMPSRQPIHIAIEILDPGKQAMNYQLRIVPQDS